MARFEKDRKRRVIYNDDSDQQYEGYEGYNYQISDEQSFIDTRTTPTFDTHVDTYAWCVGNGCEPPWGGTSVVRSCLGSAAHATDLIVDACHSKGMEVWGSLRMNDIHDSLGDLPLEETTDPLKAQHPEYLIAPMSNSKLPRVLTERFLRMAFNYARPKVRQYRLDYIERNAGAHDFDGYELDFTRFIWNFPLGEEIQHAPEMSELVRGVRERLDAIGERRGRPYTFVVHVMDSPRLSLQLGQDVEAWIDEGLVDVLVVGMGYMPFSLRLDQWLELGRRGGVPVYPSLNTNTFIPYWKTLLKRPSAWNDSIRASSAYFWQEGADGLYIFNMFCQMDANIGVFPSECVYAPLSEIGRPNTLVGKDKLYYIHPTSRGGFCHHGSETAPLPIALDNVERKLPLKIGPDATDPRAGIRVRARVTGGSAETKTWLRLNHHLLPEPTRKGDWLEVDIPQGILRPGENEISIWCDAKLEQTQTPIIVHELLVPVTYD